MVGDRRRCRTSKLIPLRCEGFCRRAEFCRLMIDSGSKTCVVDCWRRCCWRCCMVGGFCDSIIDAGRVRNEVVDWKSIAIKQTFMGSETVEIDCQSHNSLPLS